MKKTVIILAAGLFFTSCANEVSQPQKNTLLPQKATPQAKISQPKEIADFKDKIKEITRSRTIITDEQKTAVLLGVSQALLEKYGEPLKKLDKQTFKTEDEKIVYWALIRYIELNSKSNLTTELK